MKGEIFFGAPKIRREAETGVKGVGPMPDALTVNRQGLYAGRVGWPIRPPK